MNKYEELIDYDNPDDVCDKIENATQFCKKHNVKSLTDFKEIQHIVFVMQSLTDHGIIKWKENET